MCDCDIVPSGLWVAKAETEYAVCCVIGVANRLKHAHKIAQTSVPEFCVTVNGSHAYDLGIYSSFNAFIFHSSANRCMQLQCSCQLFCHAVCSGDHSWIGYEQLPTGLLRRVLEVKRPRKNFNEHDFVEV